MNFICSLNIFTSLETTTIQIKKVSGHSDSSQQTLYETNQNSAEID